ncbi:MAG: MarR family transcriptional regulator [Clostridia bacterium]|nr:MarR family transcriptional regulator [Clostridia bacterium]
MPDLRLRLIHSLSRIYTVPCLNAFAEFMQGEVRVLYHLLLNQGSEINPSQLSDALGVSRPRVTSALRSLRNKGFVLMSICEEDRRRMCVSLTEEGRAYIEEKQERLHKYLQELIQGIGEENTERMIDLLHLCAEAMADK